MATRHTPIDGLSNQKVLNLHIPTSSMRDIEHELDSVDCNPYVQYKDYSGLIADKVSASFPQKVVQMLRLMAQEGTPSVIRLQNVPYKKTHHAVIEKRVEEQRYFSEKLIIGIAEIMDCELRSSINENGGAIIHNVTPDAAFKNTISSKGIEPFYLHTDNPFQKNPPDFLILNGLEADKTAQTSYFFLESFVDAWPDWVVREASKEAFEFSSGDSFAQVERNIFPLINVDTHEHITRVRLYQNPERIKPLGEKSKEALEYVVSKMSEFEPIQSVSLQAGELLILNNGWGHDKVSGVMHGRLGKVSNPYRWLQRGYLFKR